MVRYVLCGEVCCVVRCVVSNAVLCGEVCCVVW